MLFTFCQRSTGLLCSLLCGALLHFPAAAHSTVVEPLNISELAAQSHRVVRATVVARYVLPHRGDRGEIYTRVELQVREYLLGDGPGQITVQQLGGQIGDLRMVISGNAEFEVGQEVIVFLDYAPEFELHYVVGLAQGLFVIDPTGPTPTVDRDLDGLSFYGAGPTPLATLARTQALDELLSLFSPSPLGVPTVSEGAIQ